MARISGAILRNEHSVSTVSALLQGEYGIDDICLSVPCLVGQAGAERIITAILANEEQATLKNPAQILREALNSIKV